MEEWVEHVKKVLPDAALTITKNQVSIPFPYKYDLELRILGTPVPFRFSSSSPTYACFHFFRSIFYFFKCLLSFLFVVGGVALGARVRAGSRRKRCPS
jgi:hypothetical protein